MYKVIHLKYTDNYLIAFKAKANRYFKRGAKYETCKGMEYEYCCQQSGDKIRVFKKLSVYGYNDLSLLKTKTLKSNKRLSNNAIHEIALSMI